MILINMNRQITLKGSQDLIYQRETITSNSLKNSLNFMKELRNKTMNSQRHSIKWLSMQNSERQKEIRWL